MTPREQICNTCREYNAQGLMPGMAGGMALLIEHSEQNKSIFITPEGGLRSGLRSSDLFEIKLLYDSQKIMSPGPNTSMSNNSTYYMEVLMAYPEVKCVVEIHSEALLLAASYSLQQWQKNGSNFPNEFRIANWSLLRYLGADTELKLPIIESGLDSIKLLLKDYPQTPALIVRHHGALVWGRSIAEVRSRLEILEHLCKVQIKESQLFW